MTDLGQTLARLERAQKATLSGYPADDTSTWHVHTSVRIGDEGDARRVTILQRTEVPEEWMTVVMIEHEESVSIKSIGVAMGGPPHHGEDASALAIDPAVLEVLEVGRASYSERA